MQNVKQTTAAGEVPLSGLGVQGQPLPTLLGSAGWMGAARGLEAGHGE